MLPAFHPLLFAMKRPKDTGNYSILSSSLTHRHTINNPVMLVVSGSHPGERRTLSANNKIQCDKHKREITKALWTQ